MTTKKQAAANKRNAEKSTGPKSARGKEVSKMNSVKHGLFTQPILLFSEDPQTFFAYLKSLAEQFRPVGTMEHQTVKDMAMIKLRMDRLASYERSAGNTALIQPIAAELFRIKDPYEQEERISEHSLETHDYYVDLDNQLKIGRYQTMLDNQLKKKYDFLIELQARPYSEREDSKAQVYDDDPIFDSMLVYEDRRWAIELGQDPDHAELVHYEMRRRLRKKAARIDVHRAANDADGQENDGEK